MEAPEGTIDPALLGLDPSLYDADFEQLFGTVHSIVSVNPENRHDELPNDQASGIYSANGFDVPTAIWPDDDTHQDNFFSPTTGAAPAEEYLDAAGQDQTSGIQLAFDNPVKALPIDYWHGCNNTLEGCIPCCPSDPLARFQRLMSRYAVGADTNATGLLLHDWEHEVHEIFESGWRYGLNLPHHLISPPEYEAILSRSILHGSDWLCQAIDPIHPLQLRRLSRDDEVMRYRNIGLSPTADHLFYDCGPIYRNPYRDRRCHICTKLRTPSSLGALIHHLREDHGLTARAARCPFHKGFHSVLRRCRCATLERFEGVVKALSQLRIDCILTLGCDVTDRAWRSQLEDQETSDSCNTEDDSDITYQKLRFVLEDFKLDPSREWLQVCHSESTRIKKDIRAWARLARYGCVRLEGGTMLLHKHKAQLPRRRRKRCMQPPAPSLHPPAPLACPSDTRPLKRQRQYSGYSSTNSSASSGASNLSKRPRLPTFPGGYPCTSPDCSKTFDRDCDRRQHLRSHQDKETLPYVCESCEKRFLYPKDLRRHWRTQVSCAMALGKLDLPDPGAVMTNEHQIDAESAMNGNRHS